MAQEAKGTNGRTLGSLNYFTLINQNLPDKSMMKDKTKGTYFDTLGKGSLSNIKKLFSIPVIGAKIKQFLQNVVNTISNDVDLAAKSGCYATYENRKKLRECLNQLKKCGFTVSSNAYDSIKKLRRLEDFHNKIIELNFKGEQYPIEVWLEWKNGKNILHIRTKIIFYGSNRDEKFADTNNTTKQLVIHGFNKWSGDYKVFYSAEEGKQDLKVVCEIKKQEYKNEDGTLQEKAHDAQVGLKIWLNREGRAYTTFGDYTHTWSREMPEQKMFLYNEIGLDYNNDGIADTTIPYSAEDYVNVAKHEFGHALGIYEGYTEGVTKEARNKDIQYYSQYSDIKEDIEEKEEPLVTATGFFNMVMCNSGPVINNDIEMLVLAWQNGKGQYFRGEEISEALGR